MQIGWSKEVVYVQNIWWRHDIVLNLVTVVGGSLLRVTFRRETQKATDYVQAEEAL